jgi:kinetochore protein Spc24
LSSALTKARDAARKSSTRPETVLSAEAHAAFLNEHDATRLQSAKAINETETSLSTGEAELSKLKDDMRTLESGDPALEHQAELDSTMFVLRSLYMTPADIRTKLKTQIIQGLRI